jgi:hypothetical protein
VAGVASIVTGEDRAGRHQADRGLPGASGTRLQVTSIAAVLSRERRRVTAVAGQAVGGPGGIPPAVPGALLVTVAAGARRERWLLVDLMAVSARLAVRAERRHRDAGDRRRGAVGVARGAVAGRARMVGGEAVTALALARGLDRHLLVDRHRDLGVAARAGVSGRRGQLTVHQGVALAAGKLRGDYVHEVPRRAASGRELRGDLHRRLARAALAMFVLSAAGG